ncbi:unannotated protein [freshwater metagenome]|uniref:Unannotated protein n=1 Tax=freshwater metagenome TaxID=449393 RepID=A0A6J6F3Y2_9ZZZZ
MPRSAISIFKLFLPTSVIAPLTQLPKLSAILICSPICSRITLTAWCPSSPLNSCVLPVLIWSTKKSESISEMHFERGQRNLHLCEYARLPSLVNLRVIGQTFLVTQIALYLAYLVFAPQYERLNHHGQILEVL